MTEKNSYPSDAADRFQVRMPPGLRERIAVVAKANNRSMNSEIVAALEAIYPSRDTVQEVLDMSRRIVGEISTPGAPPKIVELREVLSRMIETIEAVKE